MIEKEIIYLIVGIAFIAATIILLVVRYERARREAIRELALSIGFSYEKDFKAGPELQGFKVFNKGHSRKASNLVSGKRGHVAYKIFDYRYTVGGGKNSHTYRQTVAFAQLAYSSLPHFLLGPENFFHKIGEKFGFQDIDFEHYPEFSNHYLLRGQPEEEIRKIFKPHILEYFQTRKLKTTIEGKGNGLILYKLGKRVKPAEMNGFFDQFREIVAFFDRR